jgi:hypothetical protein
MLRARAPVAVLLNFTDQGQDRLDLNEIPEMWFGRTSIRHNSLFRMSQVTNLIAGLSRTVLFIQVASTTFRDWEYY